MNATSIAGTKIELVQGDITREAVAAIVNAANSSLLGGGGVDGAIHRAGGPEILAGCKRLVANQGRLPTGQAVITTGGKLPARHVIHTVGPIFRGGENEPRLLAACYRNSLALAVQHGLRSVAFPSISTGAYGYPLDQAAAVALRAVADFLRENPGQLELVRFVLFNAGTFHAYAQALAALPNP